MDTRGYLLVKKYDRFLDEWFLLYQNYYGARNIDTLHYDYKGIDRGALSAYIADNEIEKNPAIRKMNTILKEKQDSSRLYIDFIDDGNAFNKIEDAVLIYNLLEDKNDYELIEVRRHEFISNEYFLGYDIGYWGGDHFSIIANTLMNLKRDLYPEKDFDELLMFATLLNKNILFNDIKDANNYLEFYSNKPWAEANSPNEYANEESQFYVIQVNDCNTFIK